MDEVRKGFEEYIRNHRYPGFHLGFHWIDSPGGPYLLVEFTDRYSGEKHGRVSFTNEYWTWETATKRATAAERERCVALAESYSGKFPLASENTDRYLIQEEWGKAIAAAIRGEKKGG